VNRRRFLGSLAAALATELAPRCGFAVGKKTQLVIARAVYSGGNPEPHPDALRRLIWEVVLRTSVEADYEFPEVRLDAPELFNWPLVYLTGDREFAPWSEAQRSNLRRYLTLGGTLLVDDAAGRPASGFDQSFRREVRGLIPGSALKRLGDEHSIFRSYYLVRGVGGRVIVSPFLEGIDVEDRTPVIYCRNDLGGAWARDRLGRWSYACVPGGEPQRLAAFKLGVNTVLYAMTVNYKQDQVHAPFIRQRMR